MTKRLPSSFDNRMQDRGAKIRRKLSDTFVKTSRNE
jgi:hypothetical protein